MNSTASSPLFSTISSKCLQVSHYLLEYNLFGKILMVKKTLPSSSLWIKGWIILKENISDTIQSLDMTCCQIQHFQMLHTQLLSNKDEGTNNGKALIYESCASLISRRAPSHEQNILVQALAPTASPSWTFKGLDIYLQQQTCLPITSQWKLCTPVKVPVSSAKEKVPGSQKKTFPKNQTLS